jgi:uncharacterized membrane protein
MTRNRALLLGAILVLATATISVWAYPGLPPRVPSHWNFAGQVSGYSSRLAAVGTLPVVAAFIWLFMLVLPSISPRGFRLDSSATPFYACTLAVIATMLAIHAGVTRAQLSGVAPPAGLFLVPIGVLLVIVGSLIGRTKKNFWIGVRTPWTLASDEVWQRTNRLAGSLFVVGGALLAATSLAGNGAFPALVAIVAVVVIIPIVYSYVLYRHIEGFGENEI